MKTCRFRIVFVILAISLWLPITVSATTLSAERFVIDAAQAVMDNYYDPAQINEISLLNAALLGAQDYAQNYNENIKITPIPNNLSLDAARMRFFAKMQKLKRQTLQYTIEEKALSFAATSKMLDSCNDPHTYFISPENLARAKKLENNQSQYVGIGISMVELEPSYVYIEDVYPGSPAEQCGLKIFDRIVKIDQNHVAKSIEVQQRLVGEAGTQVAIEIERQGSLLTFTATRAAISLPISKTQVLRVDGQNYAYFKLYTFHSRWAAFYFKSDLISAIDAFNVSGIIIDVRGNFGGYLWVKDFILSYLLPPNTVIHIYKDRYENGPDYTSDVGRVINLPLVVITDRNSASCSEMLAMSLKENKRATIVGKTTMGAFSTGQAFLLPWESAMLVTASQIYTPSGESLLNRGLEPNIEVDTNFEDIKKAIDTQLEKAIDVLEESVIKK